MLGADSLKENILITRKKVDCPVQDCEIKVKRQRKGLKRRKRFRCPAHMIYISPSTFEYEKDIENLLWHSYEDLYLLNRTRIDKGEVRIARDDSEHAVAWNVFRFLDRKDLAAPVLGSLLDADLEDVETIYWSYHRGEKSTWSMLERAMKTFGVRRKRGPEPDIIVESARDLLFVEARLSSGTRSTPKRKRVPGRYMSAGFFWFPRVFTAGYREIALEERRYELMRLWLLGTWIAAQEGKRFHLLIVVREGEEEELEPSFGRLIRSDKARRFRRITWEEIYRELRKEGLSGEEGDKVVWYFENKAAGYDGDGRLRRSFRV